MKNPEKSFQGGTIGISIAAGILTMLCLLLAACPGLEPPPFTAVTDIITDVPTQATVGVPLPLTGTVEPADATNQIITWSVKEAGTTGATISENQLTTTAAGKVTITVTIANGKAEGEDFTRDFSITVTASGGFVAVTDITDVPTQATVGVPLPLTGTVEPADATDKIVIWTVKDAAGTGAIITENNLTATATGTVTITITATIANGTAEGTPFTKDFTITVITAEQSIPVMDITDVPNTAIVETPLPLTGTVTPAEATNKVITWAVKDAGNTGATISDSQLTTTAAGAVIVTASIANGTAVGTSFTKDFTIAAKESLPVFTAEQYSEGVKLIVDITNPIFSSGTISNLYFTLTTGSGLSVYPDQWLDSNGRYFGKDKIEIVYPLVEAGKTYNFEVDIQGTGKIARASVTALAGRGEFRITNAGDLALSYDKDTKTLSMTDTPKGSTINDITGLSSSWLWAFYKGDNWNDAQWVGEITDKNLIQSRTFDEGFEDLSLAGKLSETTVFVNCLYIGEYDGHRFEFGGIRCDSFMFPKFD